MKKCSICNKDLLVVLDTEGLEACDDCFFKSFTQDKKLNADSDNNESFE